MGCAASHQQTVHPKATNDKAPKQRKDSSASEDSDHESNAKPVVVFVLGGPGSGKGTQCDRIVKEYGFVHYSVGDLLRAEKDAGSKTAKLIDEYIAEGKLVPAKIPVKLLKKAMKKAGWDKNHYLVDGFPRNMENLEAWEKIFKGKVDVKFTLYYECSLEVMEKRIMERSKTSGRSDDNPESIKKRFHTYENETKPVIDHFTAKNIIRKVNAERDVEEVFADTKRHLDAIKDSLTKAQAEVKTTSAPVHAATVALAEAAAQVQPPAAQAKQPATTEVKAATTEVQPATTEVQAAVTEVQPATAEVQQPATAVASQPEQQAVEAPKQDKPNVIFVLGGPGSGKGTQCEKIIQDFGLKHLSVGDLLREEKKSGSDLAKEIDEYMTQGKLVPSEVPVKLLKQAIEAAPKGTNFLIDGFPRNKENIDEWNKLVGDSVTLKKILFFECSFETMEKRILERGKTSGRSDDNPESLKKRFDTYQNESSPVIEEYEKSGVVTKINAEREVDTVYGDTKNTLTALFH